MVKKAAEVVVIGGGCNGTSTAMHLAKRGVKDVVLLERKYLASGGTERSIANIRPYHTIEEMARVLQRSIEVFSNFEQETGKSAKFVRCGRIWAVPEEKRKMVEDAVAEHQRWGMNVRLISLEELRELMPQVDIGGVAVVAYFPDAGFCDDPVAVTGAYAARAQELGVTIYEETEATGIKVSGGKIRSVITNQGEVSTPVVVNIAGLWSDRIGRMVGIEIPITVIRAQAVHFRRPYDLLGVIPSYHDAVGVDTFGHIDYVYRFDEGEIVRMFDNWMELFTPEVADPDHYNEDVDREQVAKALKRMPQRFPALSRASHRGGVAGCYDMTPDEAPILGAVPEVEGFYCHCGWSGLGFGPSPAMGDLMAELITTGKTTLVGLEKFRLSRFKEGKLLPSGWHERK